MDFRTYYKIVYAFVALVFLCLPVQADVLGCILPHHLLASPMIDQVFNYGLRYEQYKTIVILGPNHKNVGKHNVSTADIKWRTPFGEAVPNPKIISKLISAGTAGVDNQNTQREHSIVAIVPFVKKYFPHAKIVPITFNYRTTSSEAYNLAYELSKLSSNDTLVIASVDFSHHTTASIARDNDLKSIEIISSFDFGRIYSIEADSRLAIYSLLSYLKIKKALTPIFFGNKNALDFLPASAKKAYENDVTSYLAFCFTDKESDLVSIFVTGDVMLGRGVLLKMRKSRDYCLPFLKIANLLQNVDICLINLESPIVPNPSITTEGYILSTSKDSITGLKYAGVDVVNLANNHIFDNGKEGLKYTKDQLKKNGIEVCGFDDIAMVNIKGTKYAFVGFDCTAKSFDVGQAIKIIKLAKGRADVVIAAVHWGREYSYYPTSQQKKIARKLIDSGASLIIGNHPHFVQGTEIYKGKLITYSHGNFVFDQLWLTEAQRGVIGKYTFSKNKLIDAQYIPVEINGLCQPELSSGKASEEILRHMHESSERLKNI